MGEEEGGRRGKRKKHNSKDLHVVTESVLQCQNILVQEAPEATANRRCYARSVPPGSATPRWRPCRLASSGRGQRQDEVVRGRRRPPGSERLSPGGQEVVVHAQLVDHSVQSLRAPAER